MEMVAACIAAALALSAPADPPAPPPPLPLPAADPAAPITLGEEETRMTVPVMIAEAGPYAFIVDTGSERSVISRELAASLKLSPGRAVRMTAMANTQRVNSVVIPKLSVGAIGGVRIEAPTLDAANIGAAGMLGIDTLQDRAVRIDFDRREMTVTPASRRRGDMAAEVDEIVIQARDVAGQLVVTDATYRDQRVRVVVDTGSVVTVGNDALRKIAARSPRGLQTIGLISVTGARLTAEYTQIETVRLGGTVIQNLPVAFADAPPFKQLGLARKPAIMLGMDALRLFRHVTLDFPNRELRLLLPRGTRPFPGDAARP